jgi:hypothetical protein
VGGESLQANERSHHGLSQPAMDEPLPCFGKTLSLNIRQVADIWQFIDQEINAHLPERFRGGARPRSTNQILSSLRAPANKLNVDIRAYARAADDIMALSSSGWLCQPEVPTSTEILLAGDDEVTLSANKVDGPWKNKDRYLKAHYNLLREDAVSPLRDAVEIFRRTPDMMENDNKVVSIYEKVSWQRRGDVATLIP